MTVDTAPFGSLVEAALGFKSMEFRGLNTSIPIIQIACSVVSILTCGASVAQPARGLWRVGDEIIVAETSQMIRNTGLAASPRGFVAVWSELVAGGESDEGETRVVFGAVFGPGGERVRERFRVNSTEAGEQPLPDVAIAGDGDAFVAWRSVESGEVLGQRLNSVGEPVGGELRLNNFVPSAESSQLTLTGFGDGSFLVVWPEFRLDTGDRVLKASRVGPDNTDGEDFVVSTDQSVFGQYIPSVQSNARGEFVVAWLETASSPTTRGGITALAGLEMTPIPVSTIESATRAGLDACIDDDDEIVVVWSGSEPDGYDRVWFRRYSENAPVEEPTMLRPDDRSIRQLFPSVMCMPDSFTAVWGEEDAIVRGRMLADRKSSDFRILVSGDGVFKAIASALDSETFVVSWGECPDRVTCEIRAQIFSTREPNEVCRGDCNRDGVTTVDELVTMVNIALVGGAELVRECFPGDTNPDYEIRVNELVGAVSDLLGRQCAS